VAVALDSTANRRASAVAIVALAEATAKAFIAHARVPASRLVWAARIVARSTERSACALTSSVCNVSLGSTYTPPRTKSAPGLPLPSSTGANRLRLMSESSKSDRISAGYQ